MLANSQGRGLIIWPIAIKLFQSVMLQQRPRWTGGRVIGVGSMRHAGTRPTLPWDDGDRPPTINFGRFARPPVAWQTVSRNFALCALQQKRENLSLIDDAQQAVQYGIPMPAPVVVHALKVMPTEVFKIIGVSKDSADVVLPSCTMCLFRVDRDSGNNIIYTHLGNTISGANGNYFFVVRKGSIYRVTGENGSVLGMTLNTLTGVLV